MVDKRQQNDRIISSLRSAITDGISGLDDVPALVTKVLRGRLWRERVVQRTGELVRFDSFVEFLRAKPLEGLGVELKRLQRMCADDPVALDLIDRAVQGKHGSARQPLAATAVNVDNVNIKSYRGGNSRNYALRRLRKDRPELHAQVLAGKLSYNQAMVKAGFRRSTFTVPAEPVAAARSLAKRFDSEQLRVMVGELKQALDGINPPPEKRASKTSTVAAAARTHRKPAPALVRRSSGR